MSVCCIVRLFAFECRSDRHKQKIRHQNVLLPHSLAAKMEGCRFLEFKRVGYFDAYYWIRRHGLGNGLFEHCSNKMSTSDVHIFPFVIKIGSQIPKTLWSHFYGMHSYIFIYVCICIHHHHVGILCTCCVRTAHRIRVNNPISLQIIGKTNVQVIHKTVIHKRNSEEENIDRRGTHPPPPEKTKSTKS